MKLKTEKEHKKTIIFLWTITYIIFFPFVVLQILNDILEKILKFVSGVRCSIVHRIMEFLFERGDIE